MLLTTTPPDDANGKFAPPGRSSSSSNSNRNGISNSHSSRKGHSPARASSAVDSMSGAGAAGEESETDASEEEEDDAGGSSPGELRGDRHGHGHVGLDVDVDVDLFDAADQDGTGTVPTSFQSPQQPLQSPARAGTGEAPSLRPLSSVSSPPSTLESPELSGRRGAEFRVFADILSRDGRSPSAASQSASAASRSSQMRSAAATASPPANSQFSPERSRSAMSSPASHPRSRDSRGSRSRRRFGPLSDLSRSSHSSRWQRGLDLEEGEITNAARGNAAARASHRSRTLSPPRGPSSPSSPGHWQGTPSDASSRPGSARGLHPQPPVFQGGGQAGGSGFEAPHNYQVGNSSSSTSDPSFFTRAGSKASANADRAADPSIEEAEEEEEAEGTQDETEAEDGAEEAARAYHDWASTLRGAACGPHTQAASSSSSGGAPRGAGQQECRQQRPASERWASGRTSGSPQTGTNDNGTGKDARCCSKDNSNGSSSHNDSGARHHHYSGNCKAGSSCSHEGQTNSSSERARAWNDAAKQWTSPASTELWKKLEVYAPQDLRRRAAEEADALRHELEALRRSAADASAPPFSPENVGPSATENVNPKAKAAVWKGKAKAKAAGLFHPGCSAGAAAAPAAPAANVCQVPEEEKQGAAKLAADGAERGGEVEGEPAVAAAAQEGIGHAEAQSATSNHETPKNTASDSPSVSLHSSEQVRLDLLAGSRPSELRGLRESPVLSEEGETSPAKVPSQGVPSPRGTRLHSYSSFESIEDAGPSELGDECGGAEGADSRAGSGAAGAGAGAGTAAPRGGPVNFKFGSLLETEERLLHEEQQAQQMWEENGADKAQCEEQAAGWREALAELRRARDDLRGVAESWAAGESERHSVEAHEVSRRLWENELFELVMERNAAQKELEEERAAAASAAASRGPAAGAQRELAEELLEAGRQRQAAEERARHECSEAEALRKAAKTEEATLSAERWRLHDLVERRAEASLHFAEEVQLCFEHETELRGVEEDACRRAMQERRASDDARGLLQRQVDSLLELGAQFEAQAESKYERLEASIEESAEREAQEQAMYDAERRRRSEAETEASRTESELARYAAEALTLRLQAEANAPQGNAWLRCVRSRRVSEVREEQEQLLEELHYWTDKAKHQEEAAAGTRLEEEAAIVAFSEARTHLEEESALASARLRRLERSPRGGEESDSSGSHPGGGGLPRLESPSRGRGEGAAASSQGHAASSSSAQLAGVQVDEQGRVLPTVRLLPNMPVAIRVPHFEVIRQSLLAAEVSYTVVVESFGSTTTLTRTFSNFRELHGQLASKPFGRTLRSLPQEWMFTVFSNSILERQRRSLEHYLQRLCWHAQVALEEEAVLWRWLEFDDFTQVLVRMMAAEAVGARQEVDILTQSLEAIAAVNEDISRCVVPEILNILKDVLLGENAEAAQAAARLLERLLVGYRRARQIFLSRETGGAEALLSASKGSGGVVAATAAQRVLEALCGQEEEARDQSGSPTASSPSTRQARYEVREPDPGECCVCLDRPKSHALLPCGHLCSCTECATQLLAQSQGCPVCRVRIEAVLHIFT